MRLLLIVLSINYISLCCAQTTTSPANSWINYDKIYYKIKVIENGIHRIGSQELQNFGFDISDSNMDKIQLFRMGQEVPLHIESSGGQLEQITFFGEKNDGEFDAGLYQVGEQLNQDYSLFNDTAAYFLTIGDVTGQRFEDRTANFSALPAKENYCLKQSKIIFGDSWHTGVAHSIGGVSLTESTFSKGEGFASNNTNNQIIDIPTPNATLDVPAKLNLRVCGSSGAQHQLRILLSDQLVGQTNFWSDETHELTYNVSANLITANTNLKIQGIGNSDKYKTAYTQLEYSHNFDFGGSNSFNFSIPASSSRKYLEIQNFAGGASSSQQVYLYDLTNKKRIHCHWDGSLVRTDLEPSTVDRKFILVNENLLGGCQEVNYLRRIHFVDYASSGIDYAIVSHAKLHRSLAGNNPILDYAGHRASKGFTPVCIDVQELYDQFAYGINCHPLALRNFANYANQQLPDLEYIFLIGKGRKYQTVRTHRPDDHMIPTYGSPPSDNLLMAAPGSFAPAIPVGRLAATNGDQVNIYLDKIKEMENLDPNSTALDQHGWRKKALHLGGGRNEWEQDYLGNILNTMKSQLVDGQSGMEFVSFFKENEEAITSSQSEYLDSLIDGGVSLITFLGHATLTGFDYNLDYPQEYNNKGKYPILVALGCYNGDIFNQTPQMSEKFIFEPERGASSYLAASQAITISGANSFGNQLYTNLGASCYGQGMAKAIQKSIIDLETIGMSNNIANRMVCQYMVLHGDPALGIATKTNPDFHIDLGTISHSPKQISPQTESFDLVVDLYNLGSSIDTSFSVEITRYSPDGEAIGQVNRRVVAPSYKTQLIISVPVGGEQYIGANRFSIKIDSRNEIDELEEGEQNNLVYDYMVHIESKEVHPIHPLAFAIVNEAPVLQASPEHIFATASNYVIQIDSTEHFNSPILQEAVLQQGGGLIEWQPSMNYENEVVYYWRVAALDEAEKMHWKASSFVYIEESTPGWNQSHYFQFMKDDLKQISPRVDSPKFSFAPSYLDITLRNGVTPASLLPERLATYVNGSLSWKCLCPNQSGVTVKVIDPVTSEFWQMPAYSNQYGATHCGSNSFTAPEYFFTTGDSAGVQALKNFLINIIPNNYYVILSTLNDGQIENWDPAIIQALTNEGASYLGDLQSATEILPYAFFYQKGNTAFPYQNEELADNTTDIFEMACLIPQKWHKGKITTPIVGPASDWHTASWDLTHMEDDGVDIGNLDIIGISASGERSLLFENVDATKKDILPLSSINAKDYPFLQLRMDMEDTHYKTAAWLENWRVYADWAGDLALSINGGLEREVVQGELWTVDCFVHNLGNVAMEDVLVVFELEGTGQRVEKTISKIEPGERVAVDVHFPTIELSGYYQLRVDVNPERKVEEIYTFNNLGITNLRVQSLPGMLNDLDKINVGLSNTKAFPNPFSQQINFAIDLIDMPEVTKVSLEIFTLDGKSIYTQQYVSSTYQTTLTWDGYTTSGNPAAGGIYFYRIEMADQDGSLIGNTTGKIQLIP